MRSLRNITHHICHSGGGTRAGDTLDEQHSARDRSHFNLGSGFNKVAISLIPSGAGTSHFLKTTWQLNEFASIQTKAECCTD
ncbi:MULTISPECIES: hypothetical protein [unclassified Coleofasciculus]|uniref:hypothetical protein n=1 Tax=Cyanophyceae TaxID=3028117 RepID=UPI00168994FF|nr:MULTISPECIES: hypothetical protein [unclassified Coleofasciculus]MBD1839791.1 hypothetical protein [Coleofasciculus sp. FACHB-501]